MNTELIEVGGITETTALYGQLQTAADCLRNGGLVVFPTETVYGLGGNAYDAKAAEKIYAAKGRPSDNPLIVHIADPSQAENLVYTTPLFHDLGRRFWPGPLTMILPKKDVIPYSVTGGLDTVAIRCPSDPVANALIRLADVPVAAPSANLSGHPSPTTADHVIHDLFGRVDMIVCGEPCAVGVESTVIRLADDRVQLLRPGGITYEMLCAAVGENRVTVDPVVLGKVSGDIKPMSPGMKYRHYAPKSPVILLQGERQDVLAYMQARRAENEKTGLLVYDEDYEALCGPYTMSLGGQHDIAAQAHRLFDCLRRFDETDAEIIYGPVPSKEGIGLAVYNRLGKAAGFEIRDI